MRGTSPKRPADPSGGAARGARTRAAILSQAAAMASVRGIDGLTIGGLADAIGMSKSGLYAHFGSKEELQLATVAEARRVFHADVIAPTLPTGPGRARLVALFDAFFDHLRSRRFPGGCFFAGAVLEMGSRPGPVRDKILEFQQDLAAFIRDNVTAAVDRCELPANQHPDGLTFELNGYLLAADASFVLRDDPAVLDLAAAVVRQRLGIGSPC